MTDVLIAAVVLTIVHVNVWIGLFAREALRARVRGPRPEPDAPPGELLDWYRRQDEEH